MHKYICPRAKNCDIPCTHREPHEINLLCGEGNCTSCPSCRPCLSSEIEGTETNCKVMYELEFPVAFHTVDIACVRSNEYVLLGRKANEDKWRLPGGFVDPGEDAEEAATRELKEETNINLNIKSSHYIGSYVIEDKRYKDTPHSITTSLYLVDHEGGSSSASDDLAELKWFCLKDLRIDKEIMPNHQTLLWRTKEVLASAKR